MKTPFMKISSYVYPTNYVTNSYIDNYFLLSTADDDYEFPDMPLTFTASTPAEGICFLPGIKDDELVEGMEDYTLQLSSSEVNVDASRRDATISISDDDG